MRTRTSFPVLAAAGVFVLLLVAGIRPATAGNLYVDAAATGLNNGSSWGDACTDLQAALAVAVSSDTIHVARGTYKPTAGTDRTATFQLQSGVALLGGYPTGGGDTRDPKANETILSGDIGTQGNNTDNSYHVVMGSGTDDTAVLDGFTVTGGNADKADEWVNKNGGGIYIDTGSPTLTRLTISGNSANYYGGGVYTSGWPCSPSLTDVTFSGNSASRGGGMYANGDPTLTNVTFTDNSAGGDGGGIFINGSATLTNVTFYGNSAAYCGGGVSVDDKAGPTLTHVTFANNQADADGDGEGRGGGLFNNDDTEMWIHNTVLWGNTPDQLDVGKGTIVITDSVVQGGLPVEGWRFEATNIITADPRLGTLGNYGGYTQTIPLLAGSSAIDAANADYAVDTDQRGVARPVGAGYDSGAFEADVLPPTLSFTSAGQNVPESIGRVFVTAQLSAATTQDVTFSFRVDGTASNGDDYSVPLSWWRVTIPAGSLTGDVPIDIVNDSIGGPNETVVVSMDGVTNATYGAVTQHTITIVNDDPVADPATSLLSGRVTDGDGPRGVSGVIITATPVGHGKAKTAVTDEGGYYCFKILLPGTYEVTASKTWSAFAPGPGSDEAAPVVTVPPAQHQVNFRRVGQVMGGATIAVESPNGGEEWAADATETIVWSSFELRSNVTIALSRDGGNSYTTLFASTVNDGQETWTVTGPATTQARIRITGFDADGHQVSGVSNGNFTIIEFDTTPPVLTIPAAMTAEATSPAGAVVTFAATATDVCDAQPAVVCSPLSGSVFPLGTTTVTVTATDASGNVAGGSFTVTVVDTTKPVVTIPAAMTAEATSAAGAPVAIGQATATDNVDPNPTVTNNAPALFPLGTTTVTWTATDAAGNVATGTQTVTVADTTPPVLHLPANITGVAQTSPAGAVVTFVATATDICDAHPAVVCNPPSGSVFPRGTTTVNVTATDAAGNVARGSFTVTVVDTVAPVVTAELVLVPKKHNCGHEGTYRVVASARDVGNAPLNLTAVMVSPDPTGWQVRYESSRKEKIVFLAAGRQQRVIVYGKNRAAMQAKLQEMVQLGGARVENGQRLELEKLSHPSAIVARFEFEDGKLTGVLSSVLTLRVTATDDSGNVGRAEDKPEFSCRERHHWDDDWDDEDLPRGWKDGHFDR